MSSDLEATATHRIFACERCSRRKQKCDRVLPVCSPCRAACSECTTSEREKGVVQLNGNDIARKGYVTTLLERIASLEEEVAKAGLGTDGVSGHDDPIPSEVPSPLPMPSDHQRAPPSATDARWPLDGPSMDMDTLSLSAMAEPLSRAGEFLKQLSMPRIIAGVTETYGGNPEATTRVDSLWDGISKYIRHPNGQTHRLHLNPAEAYRSLDTYLDVVDFRFPQLPVAKVKSGLDAITASDESKYKDTLAKDPAHIFMAYMVLAVVPLVSDNYPISQGSFVSIHLLGKCLKVLERVFRQEDGVDIIQCLHLLVIFAIHCSAAGSSWHLIGFAMNKCIALRYHLEFPLSAPASPRLAEELEQRRWAFWGCYHLDRLICAALGRPCSIDDRYITVALPGEDVALNSTLSLGQAFHVHLFRYSRLLSSAISESSDEDFHHSLSRLLYWRTLTPPHSEDSNQHPYLFQTSLFHTFMLWIAIQEILRSYEFSESENSTGSVNYIGDPRDATKRSVLLNVKLFDICCAVARSVDRTRMNGRHFLSLLTGYSVFSMALATLYHQLVTGGLCEKCLNDNGYAQSMSSGPSPRIASQKCIHWDDILNLACQKLEIVGRQFPRMLEYRQIIEVIRWRVPPGTYACPDEGTSPLENLVLNIGPSHLRCLALAICSLQT